MELLITVTAIVVSWFVFTGLVRILKTTVGTALKVALILFVLQIFFGIGPQTIWQKLVEFFQQALQFGK